jgi:hypothetical protein
MRRLLFWALLISGLLMIIIGFAEAHVHPGELASHHIAMAVIFTIVCLVHVILNRKAVMRYVRGNNPTR